MHLTLPIISLTEAEWTARARPLGSRQLGHNQTTGEFRKGPGLWHACAPLGVRAHSEVVAATTGNITIATALNNGDALDGVTLATGDLVLVKNQSAAKDNGIYTVGTTPARAAAYDTWAEHVGKRVRVAGGTTNKDKMFFCEAQAGGTLGDDDVVFSLQPAGNLNLADGGVLDQLPKRAFAGGQLGTMMVLAMDPTTNQLVTIEVAEISLYAND